MPTIDATWGGTQSNSYVTLDTAQTYIADNKLSSEADIWIKASNDDIAIALIRATSDIDNTYVYVGRRREIEQKLEFPRRLHIHDFAFITQTDAELLSDTEVQRIMQARIEKACIEQAYSILEEAGDKSADLHRQRQNYGIRGYSESLGPVGESYSYGQAGDFLKVVPKSYDYLKWYIANPKLVRSGAFDSYLR